MEERPNVIVIYQPPAPAGSGVGRVFVELLTFLALGLVIAVLSGGGCALR
ncbi:MAG: hypothetical protein KF832_25160 [Caldilineaceae bacterium]|nr:hypothetical protein [Caldilineaceae bacterium]